MRIKEYNYTHLTDENFLNFAVWLYKQNYEEMEDLFWKRIYVRKELERRNLFNVFYRKRLS